MTSDQLRLLWTAFGLAGTVIGIVGLGIMLWLRRDAKRTDEAIKQVRPELAGHTEGEVSDQTALTITTAIELAATAAAFFAGVASLAQVSAVALMLLVALELLLVASVVALVVLGFLKLRRRQSIARTFRIHNTAR